MLEKVITVAVLPLWLTSAACFGLWVAVYTPLLLLDAL